jgi:hypothetical protein
LINAAGGDGYEAIKGSGRFIDGDLTALHYIK